MSYLAHKQGLEQSRYFDPAIYRSEMRFLEEDVWSFACLARDVAEHNDWVTPRVGARSVIVQNFEGTIRAFDNVCSHRLCRIRTAASGNGILRCPYHSWTYNSAGVPVGVPSATEAFGLTDEDRANLALHPWQVERCGELIFLRRAWEGSTLSAQLGAYHDELSRIGSALGNEVDGYESRYDANWKVCVENTLDEYHARFVHPTTFRGLLSDDFDYDYAGWNSRMRVSASEAYLAKWRRIDRLIRNREIETSTYFHYILFPTTTIASTFGASFSLQRIVPLGPETTLLSSRFFLARSSAPEAVLATLGEAGAQFNRTVFEEDREVCNQVQLGLHESVRRPLLGRYEQRIRHFQDSLAEAMGLPGTVLRGDLNRDSL